MSTSEHELRSRSVVIADIDSAASLPTLPAAAVTNGDDAVLHVAIVATSQPAVGMADLPETSGEVTMLGVCEVVTLISGVSTGLDSVVMPLENSGVAILEAKADDASDVVVVTLSVIVDEKMLLCIDDIVVSQQVPWTDGTTGLLWASDKAIVLEVSEVVTLAGIYGMEEPGIDTTASGDCGDAVYAEFGCSADQDAEFGCDVPTILGVETVVNGRVLIMTPSCCSC